MGYPDQGSELSLQKGNRGRAVFFLFFFFFLLFWNPHLLLECRPPNDEREEDLRERYLSHLPCVVQCIQGRGLSNFTEEKWANLTWVAASPRDRERSFHLKCEPFWCPCARTYKQEKRPVSRHLLSESPRADNWCDRQFSLTSCQQNSSWTAHSSALCSLNKGLNLSPKKKKKRVGGGGGKDGKDLLVVNSNNTSRSSNQFSPYTEGCWETDGSKKMNTMVNIGEELFENVTVSAIIKAIL